MSTVVTDGKLWMWMPDVFFRELMMQGEVFMRDGKVVEVEHIETPEPPRMIADDRPAWQTKYGPARRGRR